MIAFAALVMFGPLLFFAPVVARARRQALVGYDRLGQEMLSTFEARWLGGKSDGALLGDADPSSLIDFAGAYDEVRKTKPIPLDIRRAFPALLVAGDARRRLASQPPHENRVTTTRYDECLR